MSAAVRAVFHKSDGGPLCGAPERTKEFPRIESQARVERERLDVESILKKTDTPRAPRPLKDRFHQLPPDPVPLRGRINDNRTDCSDRVTLAEKIEPDNSAVAGFGYHPENRGVSDETTDALRCDFY